MFTGGVDAGADDACAGGAGGGGADGGGADGAGGGGAELARLRSAAARHSLRCSRRCLLAEVSGLSELRFMGGVVG